MAASRARAALDAWLAQAEAVLNGTEEPTTCQGCEEESVEHGDAA